jgi:hypothetical protein
MVEIFHVYSKKIHELISYLFQPKIYILYFFQRFKGEKKSQERGPAIRLLDPSRDIFFSPLSRWKKYKI